MQQEEAARQASSEAAKLNRAKEATNAKLRIAQQKRAETDQAREDLRCGGPSPSLSPLAQQPGIANLQCMPWLVQSRQSAASVAHLQQDRMLEDCPRGCRLAHRTVRRLKRMFAEIWS